MDDKLIKKIMDFAEVKQIVISKDAIQELVNTNYTDIINSADEQGIFILDKEFILEYLKENPDKKIVVEKTNLPTEILKSIRIPAADCDADFIIPKNRMYNDTQCYKCDITDFDKYFREKYKELKKILLMHSNISPISSKALKFMKEGESVCLIGMVIEKRESKKGNIVISLDDLDGEFKIIISQSSKYFEFEKNFIVDDVFAVTGKYLGNKIIIAEEIEYPGLSNKPMKKAERDLNFALISDIHVGSKLFYENEFKNFIDWLNCKNVDAKEREEITKIKYLGIVGDAVDGVGVYPQQLSELNIIDIYEQYEELANYLKQIPEHIEIFILPGNHDAVRLADPQPAISKRFAKPLYDLKNVHFISSPSNVIVEGVNTLLYHGNSMNTLQFQLKIDPKKAELAMAKYLERRCLNPVYGFRHIAVPDPNLNMIIKDEPDIFATGHIHSNAYKQYKGTLMINPGCWQAQTVYQREQGHIPTPGQVPIIKLQKGSYFEKVFLDGNPSL